VLLVAAGLGLGAGCAQIIGADFDVHEATPGKDAGAPDGNTVSDGSAGGDAGPDAACATADCIEVLADHLEYPWDITVHEGYAYWTVQGSVSDAGIGTGKVMRVSTGGGKAEELAGGLRMPNRIVVTDDYVFWTSTIADGGVQRLRSTGGPAELYVAEAGGALGLAVDAVNVYWTAEGVVKGSPLGQASGSATVLTQPRVAPGLMAGDGQYLYFGEFTTGGSIFKLDPMVPMGEVALATGLDTPNGLAIAGAYLAFATFTVNGTIQQVNRTSGGANVLKSGQDMPTTVAFSAPFVYWPAFGGGTINKVLLGTSGSIVTLAEKQRSPNGIAVDDTHVYWTNYDPDGTVVRMLK
jgi:hypothetical protein